MATIGNINNGRTVRPSKEKGNPIITESRHSQSSLGWRDKARGGVCRCQPWARSSRSWSHREHTAKIRFLWRGRGGRGWEELKPSFFILLVLLLVELTQKPVKQKPGSAVSGTTPLHGRGKGKESTPEQSLTHTHTQFVFLLSTKLQVLSPFSLKL